MPGFVRVSTTPFDSMQGKEREISGVYYVGFRMEICAYVFHIAYTASPTRSECIRCPYCARTDCWHDGWAVGPLEILDWCLKLFWSLVLGGLGGRRKKNRTYLENLVNQKSQMRPTRRLKSLQEKYTGEVPTCGLWSHGSMGTAFKHPWEIIKKSKSIVSQLLFAA